MYLKAFFLRRVLFNDVIKKHISITPSISNSQTFTTWKSNSLSLDLNKWSKLKCHNNQRALSTSQAKIAPETWSTIVLSDEESREFVDLCPIIIKDLTDGYRNPDIPEARKLYAQALEQNISNGKKTRGYAVVYTYKMLEETLNLTPENIRLANILGWCAELLKTYFLMVEDIIKGSETRQGTPCWYKRVGMISINDAELIKHGIFAFLKDYFSHLQMYLAAIELIHDVTQKTCMGVTLDASFLKNGKLNLEACTMEAYIRMVNYKTSYLEYHLPINLGMYFANKYGIDKQTSMILLELGQYYQIQNDFSNCFGDPEKTANIGSDIQEGKCTWPVVVALERASLSQKKVIEQNYGRKDPVAVATIKNLYEELALPNAYANYKEDAYNLISARILQTPYDIPGALYFKFLDELDRTEF